MLGARKSFALAALAPLPMVVSLALYGNGTLIVELGRDFWFAAAALVFTAAVGTFVVRTLKPQYLLSEGSASWFVVASVGGGMYVLGWYYGQPFMNLSALAALYLGLGGYLGGRRVVWHLGAGILAFATIGTPFLIGGVALDATAVALATSSAFLFYCAGTFKPTAGWDCEQCLHYRVTGMQFCDRCGKMLREVRFGFPYRRLLMVVVATMGVVGLLGTSVPVVSQSGSGLLMVSYGVSGAHQVVSIPSAQGSRVALIGTQSNATLTTWQYSMSGGLHATVSVSRSARESVGGALGSRQGLVENGTTDFPSGFVGVNYAWVDGNSSYRGTLVVSPLTFVSGGQVVKGYAAFFFSGASPSSAGAGPSGLDSVAGATAAALQAAKGGYFLLSTVIGPIQSNLQYAFLVLAGVLFGIVGEKARDADATTARAFDSSLSLDPDQLRTLVTISSGLRSTTGAALLDRVAAGVPWGDFRLTLEAFSALGLLRKTIVVDRGVPKALWKCKV